MTLQVENQKTIDNPSRDQIMEAVSSLRLPSPSFAILSHSRMEYIQTAFGKDGGFVIEYQDRSIKDHFQSKRSDLTATDVADVFYAFSNGENNWKHRLQWDRIKVTPKPSLISRVSSISLLIGLVMAVPFLYGIQEDGRVKFVGLHFLTYFTLWSYVMVGASLNSLRNPDRFWGKSRSYAIIFLAVSMTVLEIFRLIKG